jgi:biotin transport system substrate-specific component
VSAFEPAPEPPVVPASPARRPVAPSTRASRVRQLTAAALIAAFMAATGWIAIPVGPVPVTLQVFGVVLAALLLSWEWAAAALAIYLVLGAAGVPVFSAGGAGVGVVLGPTGGYIIGFVLGAPIGAWLRVRLERRGVRQVVADSLAAAAVVAVIYLCGWLQLAAVMHMSLLKAFAVGVVPFVVPDVVKAAVAVAIASAVRAAGVRL